MKKENLLQRIFIFTVLSAINQFAHGQIIYTDVKPDITIKCSNSNCIQSYSLDLNNDGVPDFSIKATSSKTSNKDYKYIVEILALDGNSVGVLSCEPTWYANAYEFEFNIGSSPCWSSYGGSLKGVYASCVLNDYGVLGCTSGSFGYWRKNYDRYLGLKIILNNQTYMGWARLSVQVTSSYASFTIRDYAYESTPGQSILAGASSGTVTSKMPSHEKVKDEISDKNKINVYPNPVSNSAIIAFTISQPDNVSIKIFDMTGRLIRTLVNKEMQSGQHRVIWNTNEDNGKKVSSGIYLAKIETNNFSDTRKIIVAR